MFVLFDCTPGLECRSVYLDLPWLHICALVLHLRCDAANGVFRSLSLCLQGWATFLFFFLNVKTCHQNINSCGSTTAARQSITHTAAGSLAANTINFALCTKRIHILLYEEIRYCIIDSNILWKCNYNDDLTDTITHTHTRTAQNAAHSYITMMHNYDLHHQHTSGSIRRSVIIV